MKTTIFTKTIAILLIVFTVAFAADAQQQTFKVGDKVEFGTSDGKITYTGVITKDEGGGYYSGIIDEPAPITGNTFFRSAEMLRHYRAPVQQTSRQSVPTENNSAQTQAQAANNKSSRDCAGNDWSSWGAYKELEFMNSARDKYSTGFSISTPDLICMVKTRKVAFRLTAAEENELNELRNSPELIEAIRTSFTGGTERSKPKGSTASIATGRYACGKMAGIAGSMHFDARPDIFISAGGKYKNLSSLGTFSYDPASRAITWKSGALSGHGWNGEYSPDTITVKNEKGRFFIPAPTPRNK